MESQQSIANSLGIRTHVDDDGATWFCARDLNISSNIRTAIQKLPKSGTKSIVLNQNRCATCVSFDCLKLLLLRSRKVRATELARRFLIDVANTKLLHVETETVHYIMRAFQGVKMISQFCIDGDRRYVIDLYFPLHKVAVECDEENTHSIMRFEADMDREKYIEQKLGCTFVRYRPEAPAFCMAELINIILVALTSRGLQLMS
jgi:very-short-patch-repair endonuclease